MIVRELTIKNQSGLHARPGALWVQTANKYKSSIRVKKDAREVDGKSLLGILSLGVSAGSTIQLIVDGADEEMAVADLERFVAELKV